MPKLLNVFETQAQNQFRMCIHVLTTFTVNLKRHTLTKSHSNQGDGLQYNLINTVHRVAIHFY